MGFDRLSDIFSKLKSRYPSFNKRYAEAEAMTGWETAVGPLIAKHARALRVEKSVLWVEVDHAIWRSELHHRKNQILELLNQKANLTAAKPPAPLPTPLKDILFLDTRPANRSKFRTKV